MFEFDRTDDRLTLRREDTAWLSNGFDGGYRTADAAHNLTVPTGFDRTDLVTYTDDRLTGLPAGPTLLTGVQQRHVCGARRGPVTAVATAGLSNPAVLSMKQESSAETAERERNAHTNADDEWAHSASQSWRPGTVNVIVGTTQSLDDAGLACLLATVVEAKTATLLATADVPGTTSDAVVVGCDPSGTPSSFAGSATAVGAAARACVREAIRGSLESRYDDGPPAPEEAEYGVVTNERAAVFEIE